MTLENYPSASSFRLENRGQTMIESGIVDNAIYMTSVPDYDPDYGDLISSNDGGEYEWIVWYTETPDVYYYQPMKLYWAPRLMVEEPYFPTYVAPGSTVGVPVEWEHLPEENLPLNLRIFLQDPYADVIYVENVYEITTQSGQDNFSITVPDNTPVGVNYLWCAFIYSPDAADPYEERWGMDDTFRFNADGLPVEPETQIHVGYELEMTAPENLPKSGRDNFQLSFSWQNLPPSENYDLFYNLLEADTGNYWAAAWDHETNSTWYGSHHTLIQSSGSWETTKDLTIYDYDSFIWVAEIRDENDNLVAKDVVEAIGIPQ